MEPLTTCLAALRAVHLLHLAPGAYGGHGADHYAAGGGNRGKRGKTSPMRAQEADWCKCFGTEVRRGFDAFQPESEAKGFSCKIGLGVCASDVAERLRRDLGLMWQRECGARRRSKKVIERFQANSLFSSRRAAEAGWQKLP